MANSCPSLANSGLVRAAGLQLVTERPSRCQEAAGQLRACRTSSSMRNTRSKRRSCAVQAVSSEGICDQASGLEEPRWYDKSYWTPSASGRPRMFLAPMEGLGDKNFRAAIAAAFPCSFDEASTEFLRLTLPDDLPPDSKKAARCYEGMLRSFGYNPEELNCAQIPGMVRRPPIALQLMLGGDQADIGRGFVQWMFSPDGLEPHLRPPRIDINMGCPSKCTTSRGAKLPGGATKRKGAGSSLLRDPEDVASVARAVREGLGQNGNDVCLSVKMRTGFDDEALFEANLMAAAEYADFIQIHGRTKADGYHRPARWERIRQAKDMLRGTGCRIVGNGDITDANQAEMCVEQSGADGIMIGRAAVSNPYIFYDIRSGYGEPCGAFRSEPKEHALVFFQTYYSTLQESQTAKPGTARFERTACSKLKQMLAQGFLLNPEVSPPGLVAEMDAILRSPNPPSSQFLYGCILEAIHKHL